MTKNEFIAMIADMAINTYNTTRILPSVTIAQAILESGWGKSGLTVKANALFGIKAGSSWAGKTYNAKTQEVYNGARVNITALFRAYDSWYDSVLDHGLFLRSLGRYSNIVNNTDWKDVCDKLQSDGYATDPDYSAKLKSLISSYALYEYDNANILAPDLPPLSDDEPEGRKQVFYIVQKGDTMQKIADMHGMELAELIKLNKDRIKNPNLILPKQTVLLN